MYFIITRLYYSSSRIVGFIMNSNFLYKSIKNISISLLICPCCNVNNLFRFAVFISTVQIFVFVEDAFNLSQIIGI